MITAGQLRRMRIAGLAVQRILAGAARWRSSCRPSALLTAAPVRALIDEKISIEGHFLPPHCPVTACSQMRCENGDQWEAYAHYTTGADGTVSLSRDHSVGGMYEGCEPMGLFWGLKPCPGARDGLRLRKRNVETPYIVHLTVLDGHVCPSEGPSTELAAVTAERWYMAPGPGPFPAVLDLWGMGGGLVEYRSALLASRGYASFSIAYMGHKDLPGPKKCINVGDSYFKSAFCFLQDHPQVCRDRIGIMGLSFGTYLTLRLAMQRDVNPSCLICINGPVGSVTKLSDPDGRTEDFERVQAHWLFDSEEHVSFKNVSLPANVAPGSLVKIENLECPLMYIVGEDDLSCSSVDTANLIEETLRAAGKSELFTRLSYPGAGHLIEPPYAPNSRMSMWSIKPKKLITLWGGHPALHAAAQEDAWKKVLEFMARNLRQDESPWQRGT